MSSYRIQPKMESQPLDAIDELIRWALLDEVAGEEPAPEVWENIKANIMARSQAASSRSGIGRPLRQLASSLQIWTSGFLAPLEANWDPRLAPQERSYLLWRENLSLLMMPMAVRMVY